MPSQSDILVAWPAEHILVFRPAYESELKLSLATTTAKVSERVIADPLARKTGIQLGTVICCILIDVIPLSVLSRPKNFLWLEGRTGFGTTGWRF